MPNVLEGVPPGVVCVARFPALAPDEVFGTWLVSRPGLAEYHVVHDCSQATLSWIESSQYGGEVREYKNNRGPSGLGEGVRSGVRIFLRFLRSREGSICKMSFINSGFLLRFRRFRGALFRLAYE